METSIELLTTEEEFNKVEQLRKEVFDILPSFGVYYLNGLIENKIKAVATKSNEEIIAACYFHNRSTNLIIDQLFVKEDYQETGLKLGRKLLLDILNNKEKVEKLLNTKLQFSLIEPIDEKAEAIYKKIGYKPSNSILGTMRKTI